jgi:hypothetical protein
MALSTLIRNGRMERDNSDSCDKPPLRAETVAKTATVAVANPHSMNTDSLFEQRQGQRAG